MLRRALALLGAVAIPGASQAFLAPLASSHGACTRWEPRKSLSGCSRHHAPPAALVRAPATVLLMGRTEQEAVERDLAAARVEGGKMEDGAVEEEEEELPGGGRGFDKQSRQLVALLAGLGTLETSFLTYEKLFSPDGLSSLCSVGSISLRCGDVLNSEYANVLGVPLTLPAIFAYGSVFALALTPLLAKDPIEKEDAEMSTRGPLLVYKVGSVVTTSLLSGLIYLITSTQALVASQAYISGFPEGGPYAPPAITTHSDERALRVADRLQAMNSRMYGAFWCSHCYEQKQTLGYEAYSQVKYIECAKDGLNSQTAVCKDRKVPGYPTWEINGELFPGEKTLDQLEELTGLRERTDAPAGDIIPVSRGGQ